MNESDDPAINYIQEAEIDPDRQRTESNTTPGDENNKLAWKVEFISSIMIRWWIFRTHSERACDRSQIPRTIVHCIRFVNFKLQRSLCFIK